MFNVIKKCLNNEQILIESVNNIEEAECIIAEEILKDNKSLYFIKKGETTWNLQ